MQYSGQTLFLYSAIIQYYCMAHWQLPNIKQNGAGYKSVYYEINNARPQSQKEETEIYNV